MRPRDFAFCFVAVTLLPSCKSVDNEQTQSTDRLPATGGTSAAGAGGLATGGGGSGGSSGSGMGSTAVATRGRPMARPVRRPSTVIRPASGTLSRRRYYHPDTGLVAEVRFTFPMTAYCVQDATDAGIVGRTFDFSAPDCAPWAPPECVSGSCG